MNAETLKNFFNKIINIAEGAIGYIESFEDVGAEEMQLEIGSLRQRADNRFEVRFQNKSFYGKTETQVIDKFKQEFKKTQKKEPSPTIYQWTKQWFELYKQDLASSTKQGYTAIIEKYISKLADRLNKVDPIKIQKFLNEIKFPRQQKICFQILNQAFKKAIVLEKIAKNPMDSIDLKFQAQKKGRAFTQEEEQIFFKKSKESYMDSLFIFYLKTGVRLSEAIGSTTADVDFVKKTLKIHGTKTKASLRTLPLTEDVEKILKQIKPTDNKFFPYTRHQVYKEFKKILSDANLTNLTVHSLRHTFATRCLEKGIGLKAVQTILGHSTYKMTADTYSHVSLDFLKEELEKLK